MMTHLVETLVTICAFMLAHYASAGEQKIVCPTEIPEASIRLVDTPSGWSTYVASPLYLSSAGAMAGPPEQRAIMMGEPNSKKGKAEWSTIYNLDSTGFTAGKWMECRYGEYDQVSLSKRLDDKTKSCIVNVSKGEKAGQKSVQIVCK
jgi:hypothetical protein